MKLPFFIAKRYLLAKKSHNLINIITIVSVIGVAVGAFALIVTLSALNGFEKVIMQMVNAVSPDLLIEPVQGKTFESNALQFEQLMAQKGVASAVEVLEEDALFRYEDHQHIGRLKGVGRQYQELSMVDDIIYDGEFILEKDLFQFAVLGAGVAWYLDVNIHNSSTELQVFAPRAGAGQLISLDQGFNSRSIRPVGVFTSQQEYDARYVYAPLSWVQDILGQENRISSVEVFLEKNASVKSIKQQLSKLYGPEFSIKNRMEQQQSLYKIIRSEKWAVFIILTFILIMATFNVIGSLTILIVDKQKDRGILKSFGASDSLISRIFLSEGLLIAVAGGLSGLFAGIIIVGLQQQFGLLKLSGQSGAFVIDAYPVHLLFSDILAVFAIVLLIGGLSSLFTVRQAMKKTKSQSIIREL